MTKQYKHKPRYRKKSKPTNAADIIENAFASFRIDRKVQKYTAFPLWEEIVGESIAKVAMPEKIIRGNVLVVRVIDSAWAQELSLSKVTLMEELNNADFGSVIEDITFLTGDPKQFKKFQEDREKA